MSDLNKAKSAGRGNTSCNSSNKTEGKVEKERQEHFQAQKSSSSLLQADHLHGLGMWLDLDEIPPYKIFRIRVSTVWDTDLPWHTK